MNQEYMKVSRVAEMFGVACGVVHRWVNEGLLSKVTIGRDSFVTMESLEKLKTAAPDIAVIETNIETYYRRLKSEDVYLRNLVKARRLPMPKPGHTEIYEKLISTVEEISGLPRAALLNTKRIPAPDYRAMMYVWLREKCGMKYEEIATLFGRDHSTVVYSVKECLSREEFDSWLRNTRHKVFEALEENVPAELETK